MRFFTRLGIPAPRETHTQLYVNGEYTGLYGLVESVDKTMMGRVFGSIGDNVQNDGYLFEYNYVLGSPWRFLVRRLGPGALQGALRHQDQREPRRVADLGTDRRAGAAGQHQLGGDLRADGRSAARPAGVCPLHRGPELRRPERRLQRLRRDEQLLLLPARKQHQPRAHRLGRRQRVPAAGLRDHDANRRERADQEDARAAGSFRRSTSACCRRRRRRRRDWMRQEMQRQFDDDQRRDARPTRSSRTRTPSTPPRAKRCWRFRTARITYVRCEVAKQTGAPRPAGCQ